LYAREFYSTFNVLLDAPKESFGQQLNLSGILNAVPFKKIIFKKPYFRVIDICMKRIVVYVFLIAILTQSGCLSKNKHLDRLWFYTYSSGDVKNEVAEATPASFLYLKTDGSYTRDFGKFDYGTWKLEKSELVLSSKTNQRIIFPIKKFFNNELQLTSAKGTVLNFESQPGKFLLTSDDPFSVENNQWRVPATKKETDAQIKNRLRNHCRFNEAYFKWALDNDLNIVDVRSTPSPIKIYANGFALKEFDDLPATWRSYFFDKEDCLKANAMIKNIFEKGTIGWVHTDNRYKMFISAFQQLQEQLN
jgi:hypothetical protein